MKKILIVALSAALFCGCTRETGSEGRFHAHGMFTYTKVVDIDGHKYIIVQCDRGGGIIHAESCPCKFK